MRFSKARAVRYDSGPNMTSLVDVVMVVLIFLMLAGTFGSTHILAGHPPVNGVGRGSRTEALSLDIRIQDDASSGNFLATGPDLRIAGNSEQLLAALQTKRRAFLAAGIQPADVQVVIRPWGNVTYQHVLTIYETAGRANFPKVAFAASH